MQTKEKKWLEVEAVLMGMSSNDSYLRQKFQELKVETV